MYSMELFSSIIEEIPHLETEDMDTGNLAQRTNRCRRRQLPILEWRSVTCMISSATFH